MFLQEAIEIPARGDAEQQPELVSGEAVLAVGFEAPGFEGGAGGSWPSGIRGAANSSGISSEICISYASLGY